MHKLMISNNSSSSSDINIPQSYIYYLENMQVQSQIDTNIKTSNEMTFVLNLSNVEDLNCDILGCNDGFNFSVGINESYYVLNNFDFDEGKVTNSIKSFNSNIKLVITHNFANRKTKVFADGEKIIDKNTAKGFTDRNLYIGDNNFKCLAKAIVIYNTILSEDVCLSI